ncbi:MAG: tRNA (5-methylaminomethyl-2-thiouridine)(34)-methyltransferase MnmD [Bacteroidia bacterium]|nr:tRNA (5-methylaminomethyl-2-thiouridine)(34)-methyltransferase MnmD [Bacteroidia bacterium]
MSLQITSDGSHTVISDRYNVPYHSIHGAIQETKHVFITNGFLRCKKDILKILEIGLGTGLNALATLDSNSILQKEISYTALEAYPLEQVFVDGLNYNSFFNSTLMHAFDTIHHCHWNKNISLSESFSFKKILKKLQEFESDELFDLVYFDAFAPNAQPEMWSTAIFQKMYGLMDSGGILVTYCAKGQVKRDLRSVGFQVESPPGPPGKREMTRAIKEH